MRQVLAAFAIVAICLSPAVARDVPQPATVESLAVSLVVPPHRSCPVDVTIEVLVDAEGDRPADVTLLLGERELLTQFAVDQSQSDAGLPSVITISVNETVNTFVWALGADRASGRVPLAVIC